MDKLIYFPKMPETFFLEESTKSKFLAQFDPENPRYELVKNMYVFTDEMTENMTLSRSRPIFYWLTRNDTLELLKKVCWLIGFAINIVILSTYKLNEVQGKDDFGERRLGGSNWELGVNIASYSFAGLTFLLLAA